ncbi:MAG: hypothetical protein IRZ16_01280 [Myxococcaceae bacterium]|nr:hypothetical protein [Myxococcaceae bacterium]
MRALVLTLSLLAIAACSSGNADPPVGGSLAGLPKGNTVGGKPMDAGFIRHDAGMDAGTDAGVDAGFDAGLPDAGNDGGA